MNSTRHGATRIISVVALALGTLSLIYATVAQWLLAPAAADATPADVATAHPGVFAVLALVSVLGPLLLLMGLPPVAGLAGGRGSTLTLTGTYLTGVGLAAGIGHLAIFFGLFGDLALAGADAATVQSVGQADNANPLSTVLLIVFLVGFSLGPIVMTLGLRRARLVGVWVPVAAVIAAVANFAGGVPAGVIQLVAFTATLAAIAVAIWRGSRPAASTTVPAAAVAAAR